MHPIYLALLKLKKTKKFRFKRQGQLNCKISSSVLRGVDPEVWSFWLFWSVTYTFWTSLSVSALFDQLWIIEIKKIGVISRERQDAESALVAFHVKVFFGLNNAQTRHWTWRKTIVIKNNRDGDQNDPQRFFAPQYFLQNNSIQNIFYGNLFFYKFQTGILFTCF